MFLQYSEYVTQFNVTDRRQLFFRKYDRAAGVSFTRVQFQWHSYGACIFAKWGRAAQRRCLPLPPSVPPGRITIFRVACPCATCSRGLGPDSVSLCLINRAFTVARVQRSLRTWIQLSFIADSTPPRPTSRPPAACRLPPKSSDRPNHRRVVSACSLNVRVYFYSCLLAKSDFYSAFLPRSLSCRSLALTFSRRRCISMDIIHARADGFCTGEKVRCCTYMRGVKKRDGINTSAAAPHLLSKRACWVLSSFADKDARAELCCRHSRGIDPRSLFAVRGTGEFIHMRGVSFLNRISIIRLLSL